MANSKFGAVILAGGKGTRMGENSSSLPKYLSSIGNETLLDRQIRLFRKHGFNEITILVNDRKDRVTSHLHDLHKDIKISYVSDSEFTGTGGAVLGALQRTEDNFIVSYADTLFNLDMSRLMEFHEQKKSDYTSVVHPNSHPWDSDRVVLEKDGRIRKLFRKSEFWSEEIGNLCLAGMVLISRKFLQEMVDDFSANNRRNTDFVVDYMTPKNLQYKNFFGYHTSEYIKDAGTPDRLKDARDDLVVNFALNGFPRPVVFLDRDGTIIHHKDLLTDPEEVELLPGVENFIKSLNKLGILIIVVTNQSVLARGLCSEERLLQINRKMEGLLAKKEAFLDATYFCPHHPDSGFMGEVPELKVVCECRKPKLGLLKQAQREHDIDVDKSFYVGDTDTDALTAQGFGAKFFQIRSENKSSSQIEREFQTIEASIKELLK